MLVLQILISLMLLISPTVYAVDLYTAIAVNHVDHDNQGYTIDGGSGAVLSFGAQTEGNIYFFGEVTASGNSSGSGVAAGIGVTVDNFHLSGGIGQSKEEAVTINWTDSSDDKYEYEFIEVGMGNFYLRGSKYNVNYNFEHQSFNDDRKAFQLGYRLYF